jgi:hypothetical protein
MLPMRSSFKLITFALGFMTLLGTMAQADYNEFQSGDLSDAANAPTAVVLGKLDTRVSGVLGNGNRDYFRFTVAAGQRINSLRFASLNSTDELATIALQKGTVWSAGNKTSQMLGFALVGPDEVGKPLMGISSERPLLPGDYTIWLQQAGANADFALVLGHQAILSTRGTLKTFYSIKGRPSARQYILVKGTCLRGNVIVQAPVGYEVSTTNLPGNQGWGKTAAFASVGGELSETKLFIRFYPLSRSGAFTGRIELTSQGAIKLEQAVRGLAK